MRDVRNESVSVAFTSEEKRKLVESARVEGRSLADYIRERVLAECRVEDEMFHLLLDDLAPCSGAAARCWNRPARPRRR